jgi:hypothetical protein
METSIDPAFLASLIETLAGSWPTDSGEDTVMAAHAAIVALAPRDLVEAMLAGRMIAAHHATLDSYRRAMLPDLGDADAVRLRNNAIALGRSFDAALRMLEKRRALADGLAQPPRPARQARKSPPDVAPIDDGLAGFTPEEIADAEYALDNDPADLARAELAKRVPLHRYQDMTAEERKIAYAPRALLTPVQLAVLGARLIAPKYRAPVPNGE